MQAHVFIEKMQVKTRIGCEAPELRRWQTLIVDLVCQVDMREVIKTDMIYDAVDYCVLHRIVLHQAKVKPKLDLANDRRLLESLAYDIAVVCLSLRHVEAVTITIKKPRKLRQTSSVGITLTLNKPDLPAEESSHE